MCMPLSNKVLLESTGEKILKIGQYLAKISKKYNSLLFWAHPVDLHDMTKYRTKAGG